MYGTHKDAQQHTQNLVSRSERTYHMKKQGDIVY